MKKVLFTFLGVCITLFAHANDGRVLTSYSPNQIFRGGNMFTSGNYVSLGVLAGTNGFGLEAFVPISDGWDLHVGGTYLPFAISRDNFVFPSRETSARFKADMAKLHIMADWAPLPYFEKFVVSAGVSYFFSAKGTATVKLKEPYYYGDIEISPEDVGEVKATADWKGIAPYAGVGLNRIPFIGTATLNLALGVSYLSKPSTSIEGTNMLAGNNQNEEQLQNNLKNYRWLPSIQLSFNF